MRNTFTLLVAILCYGSLSAQISKQYLDPYPTGESISDYAVIDTSTVIAVGNNGLILRTTDNGQNWEAPNSGVTSRFFAVRFVTKLKGFAGANGLVRTTNAGATWENVGLSTSLTVTSIYFLNADTGWIGGASGMTPALMVTTDGGATWNPIATGSTKPIMSIYFFNKDNGWLGMYDGKIRHTSNGGVDWDDLTTGLTQPIYKLQFTTVNKGWLSGGSYGEQFYKTTNGGTTWGPVSLPSAGITYSSWNFFDSLRGVVAGQNVIYKTWNGGVSWNSVSAGLSNASFTVLRYGVDTLTTWGYFGSKIVRSSDNGNSWTSLSKSNLVNPNAVYFANEDTGWVIDGYGIKRTVDGGSSWTETDREVYSYQQLFFLNSKYGWSTGYQTTIIGNDTKPSPVLRTTNGGENWILSSVPTRQRMNAIYFSDKNNGWIVGDSGFVFHSTDGGNAWTVQLSPTEKELYDVKFANSTTGWISGDGLILKTTNGGANWDIQFTAFQLSIHTIHMFDADTGWAAGESGAVYKTTDGGIHWNTSYAGYNRLKAIQFIGSKYGYAGGDNNSFYYTTDGGLTWTQSAGFGSLSDMHFISTSVGYILGNGLIKISNSDAVTSVKRNDGSIPSKYLLSQNFPNPFNPSTTINYQLPINSYVLLKVYDLIGREVASLVNEQQTAGSYSVNFNASKLSSGIYFYKLQAGNNFETKRMLLLK